MSGPSSFHQSPQRRPGDESDVFLADSVGQIPDEPIPHMKSDQTLRPFIPESQEDNEEKETRPISSGMPVHITQSHMVVDGVTPPLHCPDSLGVSCVLMEGEGKGEGKGSEKKATEKKLGVLMEGLNPVPFVPQKIPHFVRHEKVLRKLGLWDFVHMDFDRDVRVDLIAQLVATYKPNSLEGYVNGYCVKVNETYLGRALNLPVKKKKKRKKKGKVGRSEVGFGREEYSEDSIEFIVEFVLDWLLLHGDEWLMPKEVSNWLEKIKDGRPEKVDWAGMVWFMVERELAQGEQLGDCYYASHLLHLMKSQHAELFFEEEKRVEAFEIDAVAKAGDYAGNEGDVKVSGVINSEMEERCVSQLQSIDLMPNEVSSYSEEMKDEPSVDCSGFMVEKELAPEEQPGDCCHASHLMMSQHAELFLKEKDSTESDEMDVGAEGVEYAVNKGDVKVGGIIDSETKDSCVARIPLVVDNDEISPLSVHDDRKRLRMDFSWGNDNDEISPLSVHDDKKRLRMDCSWENDKSTMFERIQKMVEGVRMAHEEKEFVLKHKTMNLKILLNEVQEKDAVFKNLHKITYEEVQKKNFKIHRLEHQLHSIGSLLDDYKKALKKTQIEFSKYRQRGLEAEAKET